MSRGLLFLSLVFIPLLGLSGCAPAAEPSSETPAPQKIDNSSLSDPEALIQTARSDPGTTAWQIFRDLNTPLTGSASKSWESSFRQTSSIYLPDGCKPTIPFASLPPLPPEVQQGLAALPAWGPPVGVAHNLDTDIQVDGLVLRDRFGAQPQTSRPVRYQLLMDETAFDYVILRHFYNIEGQERAAADNQPAAFPMFSEELKTSWIWIGTDQSIYDALKDAYYIVAAYYLKQDDKGLPAGWEVGYAALTGMHIIVKTQPNWMWITFENVRNPDFTQITLELPIPDYALQANQTNQAELSAMGSIFANYQLDGVQLEFTEPTGQPTLLANSNIESAFQPQSSCITCHHTSSVKPNGEHFDFVDRSGGNVGYYVGDPPSLTGWTFLDYVWSMKRAARERDCPPEESGQ